MAIGSQVTIPPIPHGTTNEKLIVGKLVEALLAAGFKLSVSDGEEIVVEKSTDPAVIFAALASTDQDTLYCWWPAGSPNAGRQSFILLIWGNDCDIISDYGMSLDDIIRPVNFFADELEG